MGKFTKVINKTDSVIELKQGSANVFLQLHSLQPEKSYNINVDESATYREYWCAMQPNTSTDRVVFSSDDCAEFSKVKIYKDSDDKFKWKGTEKRGTYRNIPIPEGPTPISTPIPTPVPNSVPTLVSTSDTTPVRRSLGRRVLEYFRN